VDARNFKIVDNQMGFDRPPIAFRYFRADSWIKKVEDLAGSDIDGRFIFLWVAFNARYGQPKYLKKEPGCERYGRDEEMDIQKFLDVIYQLERKGQIHTAPDPLNQDIEELTNDLS